MDRTILFNDFSEVSPEQWKQRIQRDLKGADYEDALVWETSEGIKVRPFYHADDDVEAFSNTSKKSKSWNIAVNIEAGNVIQANSRAKEAVQGGSESLNFVVTSEEIQIENLLKGIDLEAVPISLNLRFLSEDYIQSIVDFSGDAIHNLRIAIDIIGNLARTGKWYFDNPKDHALLRNMLSKNQAVTCGIDLSLYQNAGATIVQQLAYGLAHANEYLNSFHSAQSVQATDRPAADTRAFEGNVSPFCFNVSVGTNYFFEIAKLRALRILWKTLSEAYAVQTDCHITASPTRRNKTIYDYNTNMLRTTVENMAAVLGGADTVFNLPYDAIYHRENDFGNRIALNQLLLLKHESHFDKTGNPADGSYYIETLTRELSEKALAHFKEIENNGGFISQLKTGVIQAEIEKSAQAEQKRFDDGEEILVGTNKYRDDADIMKGNLELDPFNVPTTKLAPENTTLRPIMEKRLSESMERERLKNE